MTSLDDKLCFTYMFWYEMWVHVGSDKQVSFIGQCLYDWNFGQYFQSDQKLLSHLTRQCSSIMIVIFYVCTCTCRHIDSCSYSRSFELAGFQLKNQLWVSTGFQCLLKCNLLLPCPPHTYCSIKHIHNTNTLHCLRGAKPVGYELSAFKFYWSKLNLLYRSQKTKKLDFCRKIVFQNKKYEFIS